MDDYADFGEICRLRRLVGWEVWEADEKQVIAGYLTRTATLAHGRLVGWAGSVQWQGDQVMLVDLMVHPQHRCCGIASELVLRTSRLLYRRGVSSIETMCYLDNRRLFEKCGFRTCVQPEWNGLLRLARTAEQTG